MRARRTVLVLLLVVALAGCGAFAPDEEGAEEARSTLEGLPAVESVEFEQAGGVDMGWTTTYHVTMTADAGAGAVADFLESSVPITDEVKGGTDMHVVRAGRDDIEIVGGYDDFRDDRAHDVARRFVAISELDIPGKSVVTVVGDRVIVDVPGLEEIGAWAGLVAADDAMASWVGWEFKVAGAPIRFAVRGDPLSADHVDVWREVAAGLAATPTLRLYSLQVTLSPDGGRVAVVLTEHSSLPSTEYTRAAHADEAGPLIRALGSLARQHRLTLVVDRYVPDVDEGGGATLLEMNDGQVAPRRSGLGWERLAARG